MSAPHPNDIPRAVVNAAQRIHASVSLIRRLRSQVGDHRDLEPEVEEALQVLTAWAAMAVATNSAHAVPKEQPSPIEPGPLAARPRSRQPLRRTRR